jgi:hypothetical protein
VDDANDNNDNLDYHHSGKSTFFGHLPQRQ